MKQDIIFGNINQKKQHIKLFQAVLQQERSVLGLWANPSQNINIQAPRYFVLSAFQQMDVF